MTQWGKGTGFISAVLMLSVLAGSPAQSQQPSPEQVSAIRSSCRSDFMARCAGVTPGGADALACLRKNVAQLTPRCQAAVKAGSPNPAPASVAAAPPPSAPAAVPTAAPAPQAASPQAASPQAAAPAVQPPAGQPPAGQPPAGVPSSDQVAAIRAACPSDFAAHCAGVPPGGLEGLSCLQRNAAKLSAPCRFAVTPSGMAAPAQTATPTPAGPTAKPPTPRRAAAPAAAPPPAQRAAAATPAAAAPTQPTAEQQAAIRASCRSDFMSRCSGVQPGGADALACLKRNSAQLSTACRSAVGAIGSPAAATAAPAAAPAAATAAQQSAIKSACQRDFMMNCRGVQPGGQEAFMCLQRNSSRLSPRCQGALTAVASGTTPVAAAPPPAARPPGLFPVRRAIRERLMGN
ncbi:cysteine rich repeat-containing protein [Xanthobacteraceae bacterium Astr-EGSB]|uniref:cysteine rich repeat-containing protein n=1 Tax=Astrobacterium formosum TaxID=3069710 RepID=UPI0027B6F419|nr:cysteine rich repeat-containing protein [Xanthobacteraceae bacterium Astr-EGSB]